MALAEHNNKVGNATIDYVDMDDATAARGSWDPAQEASNANKAGPDPDVMVYLGTFNSNSHTDLTSQRYRLCSCNCSNAKDDEEDPGQNC